MHMNIVFDPCVFSMDSSNIGLELNEIAHFEYLRDIVNFIDEYFPTTIMYTDLLYSDIIRTNEHPWNQYKYYRGNLTDTKSKILRNLSDDFHLVTNEALAKDLTVLHVPNAKQNTLESFLKTIHYILSNGIDAVVYLGLSNKNATKPLKFFCRDNTHEITAIFDPYTDDGKDCIDLLCSSKRLYCEPCLSNLFPNSDICKKRNDIFLKLLAGAGKNKIPLIEKTGYDIAKLNNYSYDLSLTQKNSKHFNSIRSIFTYTGKQIIYLSIDFENGGFEVFDHNRKHLGPFSFGGKQIGPPTPSTHKLVI